MTPPIDGSSKDSTILAIVSFSYKVGPSVSITISPLEMLNPRLTARALPCLNASWYKSYFIIESAFYYFGSIVGRSRINHNYLHLLLGYELSNMLSSLRSITESFVVYW